MKTTAIATIPTALVFALASLVGGCATEHLEEGAATESDEAAISSSYLIDPTKTFTIADVSDVTPVLGPGTSIFAFGTEVPCSDCKGIGGTCKSGRGTVGTCECDNKQCEQDRYDLCVTKFGTEACGDAKPKALTQFQAY